MWDLLAVAPTSAEGARMSSVCVQRILKANRIRKVSADEVLTALRTAPLILAPGPAESALEHFQLPLLQVKHIEEKLREVGNRIKRLLCAMMVNAETEQPPCDAGLSLSIPGIGPAVAAALLTEVTRPIGEWTARRCGHAGTAPVTRQSGERKTVGMRQACKPRLRNTAFYWATTSFCGDSRSRDSTTVCGRQATIMHGHCAG